jgi:lipid-binding SYLF domain-containing protein
MNRSRTRRLSILLSTATLVSMSLFATAYAATAEDLDNASAQALQALYRTNPLAEMLSHKAKAVLIFPNIVKAGLIFGGSYGEGELRKGMKVDGYYNSVTASWGLQAGAQSYGYAVFLMTNEAQKYVHDSHGWEIGVGPTVVMVDEGVAKNLSTSTLKDDAYAFIFGQQGLMAGVSIEGTKISPIKR